jgi:hypothetical protein
MKDCVGSASPEPLEKNWMALVMAIKAAAPSNSNAARVLNTSWISAGQWKEWVDLSFNFCIVDIK